MTRALQKFDYRSNPYERVNQKWLCGHSVHGKACRLGPDRKGKCRAGGECVPRRSGDRWVCTRPPSAGGACSEGPFPDGRCCQQIRECVPVPSIRARRAKTVRWVFAVTVALVVLILNGSTKRLTPGDLTLHHQNIATCDSCHEDHGENPTSLIVAAFAPGGATLQGRKCLSCHELGESPFSPHSLRPENLEVNSGMSNLGSAKFAALFFAGPMEKGSEFACANCHQEHRGPGFDMRQMSNQRCQSCHSVQFAAFSRGHPQFSDYPYRWRTRIAFDHVAHIKRHFPDSREEMAPTMCSDCHESDPTGRMMLLKTFSDVCSSCHLDQIEGSSLAGPKGIAFLNVPGLDLEVLRERDAQIGEWPEFADAKPTPFLRLLLESSSDSNLDFELIQRLDLLDLTDATDDDILAVSRMAWAIKELMHDLVSSGFDDPGKALSARFGQKLDRVAIRRMVGGLSLDTLRAANSAWFPNLSQEVALYRTGVGVPIPGESADTVAAVESDPGTRIEGGEDILSGTSSDGTAEDILAGLGTESQGDDILGEAAGGSRDDDILAGLGSGSESGDILAGPGTEDQGGDILGATGMEAELLSLSGSEEKLLASSPVSEEAVEPSQIDAEAWSEFGGWYLQYFTIYYRPLGHADRFLRTWLDVSANAFGTVNEPAGDAIFSLLVDDNSPGQCGKCHTVDRERDGRLNVKWKPALPRPGVKSFTKFAHDTHFSLLDEMGCKTCHSFNMGRAESSEVPSMDFEKMSLEACATCHVDRKAGDTCLLCHNYHVGKFPTAPVPTRMHTAASSAN